MTSSSLTSSSLTSSSLTSSSSPSSPSSWISSWISSWNSSTGVVSTASAAPREADSRYSEKEPSTRNSPRRVTRRFVIFPAASHTSARHRPTFSARSFPIHDLAGLNVTSSARYFSFVGPRRRSSSASASTRSRSPRASSSASSPSSVVSTASPLSWSTYSRRDRVDGGFPDASASASTRRSENAPRFHRGSRERFFGWPNSSRSSSIPRRVPSTRSAAPRLVISYVSDGAYMRSTGPNTALPNSQCILARKSGMFRTASTNRGRLRSNSRLDRSSVAAKSRRVIQRLPMCVASWSAVHPPPERASTG